MIITYNLCEKYDTMLYVPDNMPWKLAAEIDEICEDSEDFNDHYTSYALKLVTGSGMEETILHTEEFIGTIPEELDEEKEILSFFNSVIEEATWDLTQALMDKAITFDLGKTIASAKENWRIQLKAAAQSE